MSIRLANPSLMRLVPAALGVLIASACGEPVPLADTEARDHFPDIGAAVGLDFVHDAGLDGRMIMPESIGAGVALFDHDGDGDLDVYLVNGGPLDNAEDGSVTNRLFSQEAGGRFVDRTAASGLGDAGYGMGATLGDIDNDGDLDLFVSNYGADTLYRNEGNGRFRDVTRDAGITGDQWSTSACFLDFDLDGWLDLYVARYVQDRPARACTDSAGRKEYCGPATYRGVVDGLWHNQGGGVFADVHQTSGIGRVAGRGLGVVSADFNADGWPDVFVANDGEANQMWINDGEGGFEDQALTRGVAFNSFGKPEASMGIALGDLDGDLHLDLYLTHLVRETNTLYTGGETGMRDSTSLTGSGAESMPYTGFGTAFFDADQDGDLDLVVANGRVTRNDPVPEPLPLDDAAARFAAEYGEPNLLYFSDGAGVLRNGCEDATEFCGASLVSRGLATGDLDEDGDLDMVVSNGHGPTRMFRNDLPEQGNWLKIRAVDPALKRDAIGAVIEVEAGGSRMIRPVTACYSYLSSSEPVAHFGLGPADRADRIRVTWPGGATEVFSGVAANRAVTLLRGQGEPAP